MARDIESKRTVIQQVAKNPSGVMSAVADIGQQIIKTSQAAKMSENLASTQLDLNALSTEYQIQNQSDPFGGLDAYKQQRQAIIDGYGKEISPLFRRDWQNSTRGLTSNNDLNMQSWGYKQSKNNTITSINNSIKTSLTQAQIDGKAFGLDGSMDLEAATNFTTFMSNTAKMGVEYLGEEETKALLSSYPEDHIKMFVSGAAETSPVEALKLMDTDDVKNAFTDSKQYSKMKTALENKAISFNKFNAQKEIVNVMKNENSALAKVMTGTPSYAELHLAATTSGMSDVAVSTIMRASGFKAKAAKMSKSEKFSNESELQNSITKFIIKSSALGDGTEFISGEKEYKDTMSGLYDLQKEIYSSLDKGVISNEKAISYLGELISPIAEKRSNISVLESATPFFNDSLGLDSVNEFYKENIHVKDGVEINNNANKIRLMDEYYASLASQAQSKNIKVAQIPDLSRGERNKIYKKALESSTAAYFEHKVPALRMLDDLPNKLVTSGQMTGVSSGKRNLTADDKINFKPDAKKFKYKDGTWHWFSLNKDGSKKSYIGKVEDGS